jgi:hypothetical protein
MASILILVIGVSFINPAIARPLMALLGVFGLSLQFIWNKTGSLGVREKAR